MADFKPFHALRYDPAVAGAASDLVAPPYDVVSGDERAALYGRSPYNISHVDYGKGNPGDTETDNRYTRAAGTLAGWRRDGVLTTDGEARIFVYDQEFTIRGQRTKRRSVFGRLRLEEWEEGIVLPHEVTGAQAKADRMNLIQATSVHLSPVMALHKSDAMSLLGPEALGEPVLDAELPGERHVLRPVSPAVALAFCAAIADQRLYIADGHHRYETGLDYRNRRRTLAQVWTGEEAENFILAALVAAEEPGLVVLPTDRILRLPDPKVDIEARLQDLFDIIQAANLDELASMLASAGQDKPAFGLVGPGDSKFRLVVPKNVDSAAALTPPDHADAWRRLDVTIVHHAVLSQIGFNEAPEDIDYTEDHSQAAAEVASGRWDLAVLLNPTPVEQIIAVADTGDRMPRKSTFFFPKLGTGVVMLPLD